MLLDDHRPTVKRLRGLARLLRIGLGWHYLMDLSWILDRLPVVPGATVLDAGAGLGILQWHLCESRLRVISVDRDSRARLPLRFRARYRIRGLRPGDLEPVGPSLSRELRADGLSIRGPARQARNAVERARRLVRHDGDVIVYNRDLRDLADLADGSVDHVVAVSALEHNPPEDLELVVRELLRVLKPGGRLIATLGAARDHDWFHAPSKGWCYTDRTLRRIFRIENSVMSNYDRYDELLMKLRDNAELRNGLARFYFHSGSNGMPWGVWDPQYQPVGVCTTKPAT
jgi:SAM-dependent methyltransferase